MPSRRRRSTSRRPTARVTAARSPGWAGRSATRSPRWRRPAGWPSTTACARRSRPASWTCSGSRASGPRPCASSGRASASRAWTTSGGPPRRATCAASRASRPATEQRILEGITLLDVASAAHAAGPGAGDLGRAGRAAGGHAGRATRSSRRARSGAAARPSATWTCWSRRTRPRHVIDRFVHLSAVDGVLGAGQAKAAVRLAGGPQVDLMVMPPGEAGTYLVHFTGSAEHNVRLRAIARDRGWSLSEKGFLRLDDDGEPRDGRRSRAAHLRGRGGRLRLPRPAVHRARAARGRGRDRGGATRAGCRRWSRSTTCAATCTATPTGATASTRSRSWPRPPGAAAMPTRC